MVHITRTINVDSRARKNVTDPSTDFTLILAKAITNIYKLRIASIEIPNMWYNVTSEYRATDTTIKVKHYGDITTDHTIIIPDGIYMPDDIIFLLNEKFKTINNTFNITLDVHTLKISITCCKKFAISFLQTDNPSLLKYYHIGHMLGFISAKTYPSAILDEMTHILKSESAIDFVGPSYILLTLNEIGHIDHYTTSGTTTATASSTGKSFRCIAKIIVREEKGGVIYDDGSTLIGNSITLITPTTLQELKISLRNSYNELIHLNGLDFSFTLEVEYEQTV